MHTMQGVSAVKNVESELLNQRICRRKPGQLNYPSDYSTEMLNFDQWDHLFFSSCAGNLTMHRFESPPESVLDLGCGGGLWTIEAAKRWTSSMITGFDIKKVQPKLCAIPNFGSIATRIKWVHGNLLERLPFHSRTFDFVRMAGVGLGVPEDEWQFVLEEVARVLKPDGVLELIEEDLIFPCPKPRVPLRTMNGVSRTISKASSLFSLSSTILSDTCTVYSELDDVRPFKDKSNVLSSVPEFSYPWPQRTSPTSASTSSPPFSPVSSTNNHSSFVFGTRKIPSTLPQNFAELHPEPSVSSLQDHSRLKAAWDAMLANRFLAPQLVTVLPLYLNSSFGDVQTHTPLRIALPPNSNQKPRNTNDDSGSSSASDSFDPDVVFTFRASGRKSYTPEPSRLPAASSFDGNLTFAASMKSTHRLVSASPRMHLAKVVASITACKEAMWLEWENLYGNDPNTPLVTRTSRPKVGQVFSSKASGREDFETAWSNWECDMMDRINMRSIVSSEFGWSEPAGDQPAWRTWRGNVLGKDETRKSEISPQTPDIPVVQCLPSDACRVIRVFICMKPS